MIIYVNQKSKRKRKKPDAKARALQDSWEKILQKHELKETKNLKIKKISGSYYIRDGSSTKHISSLDTGLGLTPKKETLKYTGDEMIGIGQLHKSNAVPIFKKEDAVEISKMRRG